MNEEFKFKFSNIKYDNQHLRAVRWFNLNYDKFAVIDRK